MPIRVLHHAGVTVKASRQAVQGLRADRLLWQHTPSIAYRLETLQRTGRYVTLQEEASGAYSTVYTTILDPQRGTIVAQAQGNYLGTLQGQLLFETLSPLDEIKIGPFLPDLALLLVDEQTGITETLSIPVSLSEPFPRDCIDSQMRAVTYRTLTRLQSQPDQLALTARGTLCQFNFTLSLSPLKFSVTDVVKLP